ncbi:restriction endonuclease [Sphingobacteriaceae bacterium]|nr:restriction endonuclease [Sphingobacteriaceae bacterium]
MSLTLPKYISHQEVVRRLPLVFPEGTPNRNYCTRELSASTIFTMLYIGAVEGLDRYLGPIHVYRMTEEQSLKSDLLSRNNYLSLALKKGAVIDGKRWYADNTREPIRDETLREGLQQVGAVKSIVVPTTSSKPRYYLEKNFAALFNPEIEDIDLLKKIKKWQESNLSKHGLTRISLASFSASGAGDKVLVTFPNGETRHMSAGPSSEISKSVIEVFAKTFLNDPVVLWLSESGNKEVARDEKIAHSIGIEIRKESELPDIILVDLNNKKPLLIFIEVVATDGPITRRRQEALYKITDKAGFDKKNVLFVSAFKDRESTGSRKSLPVLAWNSFAWFASEPDKIMHLKDGIYKLSKLNSF